MTLLDDIRDAWSAARNDPFGTACVLIIAFVLIAVVAL